MAAAAPIGTSCSALFEEKGGYWYQKFINERDMEVDEAITYLVLSRISEFLQQRNSNFKNEEVLNLTIPPLSLKDLKFGLYLIETQSAITFIDSKSEDGEKILIFREDVTAIERRIEEVTNIKTECEEGQQKIVHLVAKKVSEFILSNGLITSPNLKQKIADLNNSPLSLDQLALLKNLIKVQDDLEENIIIRSDDDSRVEGRVMYVLEIPVEDLPEADRENVHQGLKKVLSIAGCAYSCIELQFNLLKQ